jgi:beta-glucosidase
VNPSGKLPITFPKNLIDSPAHKTGPSRTYPGDEYERVFYDEGIFVGYRWFDEKEIEPLFPFGFGLSYTDFNFKYMEIEKRTISSLKDIIHVQIGIENIGQCKGKEVIQLYFTDLDSSVSRPPQELAGFEKVELDSGETKTVNLVLKSQDLAFYSVEQNDWKIEPGDFKLQVGSSSRTILLNTECEYIG